MNGQFKFTRAIGTRNSFSQQANGGLGAAMACRKEPEISNDMQEY